MNRDKILKSAIKGSALAIQADMVVTKSKEEVRELVRDHDVIYIYQDRIDFRGHKQKTEREVSRQQKKPWRRSSSWFAS